MTDRLEVLATREYQSGGETKTAFIRIGAAFPLKKGNGYQVVMDAMPAPKDGQFKVLLMPPKDDNKDPF